MKNFRFVKKTIAGQIVLGLVSNDGEVIECVEGFAKKLFSLNSSTNTVLTYTKSVAKYLDAAVECMCEMEKADYKNVEHINIMDVFFQALSIGVDSECALVRKVTKSLSIQPATPRSYSIYKSALTLFCEFSDKQVDELPGAEDGLVVLQFPNEKEPVVTFKQRGWYKRKVNSYLSECISGGVGVKQLNNIPSYFVGSASRTLGPLKLNTDDISRLINATESIRDKTYYALLGAGGARISETLQVIRDDIDEDSRTVRIVNPKTRRAKYLKMGLTLSEVNSLSYKGRTLENLTMIEPFATMFWEFYSKLLVSPELPVMDCRGSYITHQFVFCVYKGETKGKPLCLVDQSPILRTFKKNLKKVKSDVACQHDVRHMHVSYLCNDIPTRTGKGLGVKKTSSIVGHINIESTERYNHVDSKDALAEAEAFYLENGFYEEILLGAPDAN